MTLPQKALFVHDSVRANMTLWDEDGDDSDQSVTPEQTDARIEAALAKVGLWDALFTRKAPPAGESPGTPSSSSTPSSISDKVKEKTTTVEAVEPEALSLDMPLDPSERLSIGQQQLFCLARALFQRGGARIVLMDEFTSSMDGETEILVRDIVGRELGDRTVVEVLHRLEHILDFDLVIVMDGGRVAEVGHPEELLQNEDGLLRGLYQSMRG